MTQLLQMSGNITYSTAGDYTDLLSLLMSVQAIAMAYHPVINNLLYILYSSTVSVAQLEIWQIDSSGRTVASNTTLNNALNSTGSLFSTQLSSRILLIECYTDVYLYGIQENGRNLVNSSAFNIIPKSSLSGMIGTHDIKRRAAVQGNKCVYYNGSALQVTVYNTNDPLYPSIGVYNMTTNESFSLFTLSMSKDYVIWALDKNDAKIVYTSLSCIMTGYDKNGSSCVAGSVVTYPTGLSVTKNFKIISTNSSDQKSVIWVLIDGDASRYLINATSLTLRQQVIGNNFKDLSYNNQYVLFYNNNKTYQLRSFQVQTIFSQNLFYTLQTTIELAAINSDRTQLSVFSSPVTHQYLIIDECDNYQAKRNGSYCQCLVYDGIFCARVVSSQTGGLPSYAIPVMAVIAAVAITLIAVVSRWIYKKHCKAPKNNRIPYKYEQTQLMSFQM